MTNWPGPNRGPTDQLDPHAQHDAQYRQPWGNPAPNQEPSAPGAPDAYQQPWNQPAPQGPSAQPWAQPASQGPSAQPWAQPAHQGPSTQPWGQPPSAGGPPPGWGAGPSELGLDGPTPPKSRKRLLIAAAVVALVAALAFVGYRVSSGEGIAGFGATPRLSPSQTVQQYLEALAAGDAEKALSFGASKPANTDLLTNEILAKQNAEMPITNIRILGQDNSGEIIGNTTVHVAVNFGDVVDDTQLRLKRDDDGAWKLEYAAVKIDSPPAVGTVKAWNTVTIFGKAINKGPLYVFPGYMDVGSTNEYFKVTADPVLLKGLSTYGGALSMRPEVTLNDAGRDAIEQAIADEFANCQASGQLNPPGCPTEIRPYEARGAVDGSVTWGQADLSEVTIGNLSPFYMTVTISGSVKVPVTFQTTDGETMTGDAKDYVTAQADMTTAPPTLKWN